jgi:hypothetical protein
MPASPKPIAKKAFPLRLDPALHAAIERAAAADFRSANAQIEVLLRVADYLVVINCVVLLSLVKTTLLTNIKMHLIDTKPNVPHD